MANFKVGQRVKRVRDPVQLSARYTALPIGETGTVTGFQAGNSGPTCLVTVHPDSGLTDWGCDPETLEPLTDPLAEQFIERIKKLAREPAPVRETERSTESIER